MTHLYRKLYTILQWLNHNIQSEANFQAEAQLELRLCANFKKCKMCIYYFLLIKLKSRL